MCKRGRYLSFTRTSRFPSDIFHTICCQFFQIFHSLNIQKKPKPTNFIYKEKKQGHEGVRSELAKTKTQICDNING